MNHGICFFVDYNEPAPLLVVALHSLMRYYDGPIHVVYGKHIPQMLLSYMQRCPRISISPLRLRYGRYSQKRRCWYIKPQLHQHLPFESNLLYDADHVFIREFDVAIFDVIRERGLVTCNSIIDRKHRRVLRNRTKRLRALLGLSEKEYQSQQVTNGGCVGSIPESPLVQQWIDTMEKILAKGAGQLWKVADEMSLGVVLALNDVAAYDRRYSYVPPGVHPDRVTIPRDTIAVHFSRGAFAQSEIFAKALDRARVDDFLGLNRFWDQYMACNSMLSGHHMASTEVAKARQRRAKWIQEQVAIMRKA